jgi:hypothetical protein
MPCGADGDTSIVVAKLALANAAQLQKTDKRATRKDAKDP